MMKFKRCPAKMMCPEYTRDKEFCEGEECEWWLGNACAVAYSGAKAKSELTKWRDDRR